MRHRVALRCMRRFREGVRAGTRTRAPAIASVSSARVLSSARSGARARGKCLASLLPLPLGLVPLRPRPRVLGEVDVGGGGARLPEGVLLRGHRALRTAGEVLVLLLQLVLLLCPRKKSRGRLRGRKALVHTSASLTSSQLARLRTSIRSRNCKLRCGSRCVARAHSVDQPSQGATS